MLGSFRSAYPFAVALVTILALAHQFRLSKQLSQSLLQSHGDVDPITAYFLQTDDVGSDTIYPTESFCVEWKRSDADNRTIQPVDEWWTHHVEYDVVSENFTHVCFQRAISAKTVMFLRLYENQFHTTCEKVHLRYIWGSGWGSGFQNVIGGFFDALEKHSAPLVMGWNPEYPKAWHYATNMDDFSNQTCPEMDLSCYFVPYHPCGKQGEITNNTVDEERGSVVFPYDPKALQVYQYGTRPLWWLRRSVFDYIQKENLGLRRGQCSVIHVRRADVTLETFPRKYYPVESYVDRLPGDARQNHDILLLTDDENAIKEAHEGFPDMKWKYVDRPRHKGASGGLDGHTPSRNPAGEVIAILGAFEMVQNCVNLVHSSSGFSDMLWVYMEMQNNHQVNRFLVDENGAEYKGPKEQPTEDETP